MSTEDETRRPGAGRWLPALGLGLAGAIFAGDLAHQVRNPLAGIKGAIEIIGGRLPEHSADH